MTRATLPDPPESLAELKRALRSRRRFLMQAAGGSLALLFGSSVSANARSSDAWRTLDAVLRHLFPSEPNAPGATEIHALAYLRRASKDPFVDSDERAFIPRGAGWLEEVAQKAHRRPFHELNAGQRESTLRFIAARPVGENWISTLLVYLLEALLTAPAYGGNPDGIGWRWLRHTPGFPLPDADTLYWKLPHA